MTTGIKPCQTEAGIPMNHTQSAPPTECAANVVPSARATSDLPWKNDIAIGISQNMLKYHASLPTGLTMKATMAAAGTATRTHRYLPSWDEKYTTANSIGKNLMMVP